jgi:hypothetical protein
MPPLFAFYQGNNHPVRVGCAPAYHEESESSGNVSACIIPLMG